MPSARVDKYVTVPPPEQEPGEKTATPHKQSENPSRNAPLQLCLEGIAQGGESVGHYAGKVVFVRGGIPGEHVVVRVTESKQRYARGIVQAVLSPAQVRVQPRCPLFGRCGGCHWQHIVYPAQLAFKQDILEEQCRHLGRISSPPIAPGIGMDPPWNYRSTAELHVSPSGRIGYHAWHSHVVVPLDECPLLVPALNDLLRPLQAGLEEIAHQDRPARVRLRYSRREDLSSVLLQGGTRLGTNILQDRLASHAAEISWLQGRRVRTMAGRGYIYETVAQTRLQVSPTSFFQVNVSQAQRLQQVVLCLLDPRPDDRLLDAYAGVGALSLPLVQQVGRITAIESHAAAVEDLRSNSHALGRAEKVEVTAGAVEEVLPSLVRRSARRTGPFDLVLLDPPRRGCESAALKSILQGRPRRIVYVSCHPGTLARDLRVLQQGGYALRVVQPVDLFPHTFHVEAVALLEPNP